MSLDDFKAQYAAGSNAIESVHSLYVSRAGAPPRRHSLTLSFSSSPSSFPPPPPPPPLRPSSKAKINFSASKPDAAGESIYVFYSEEASVGIKTMRKCVRPPSPRAPSRRKPEGSC